MAVEAQTKYQRYSIVISCVVLLILASIFVESFNFGNDTAAHLYLTWLYKHEGMTYWDNFWYFGRISFYGYSYTYYPIAVLLGVKIPALIGLLSIQLLVSSGLVVRLPVRSGFVSSVVVAVSLSTLILTGAYPFLLSLAPLSLALYAYFRGYRSLMVLSAALSAATSPLELLALGVFVLSRLCICVSERVENNKGFLVREIWKGIYEFFSQWMNALAVIEILLISGVMVAITHFLGVGGTYPFYGTDLALLSVGVILWGIYAGVLFERAQRNLFMLLGGTYLVVAVVAFTVKSSLGGNVARVGEFSPVITLFIWSYFNRGAALPKARRFNKLYFPFLLTYSFAWMANSVEAPVFDPNQGILTASETWVPLTRYLKSHFYESRIEYVDSLLHEGAYFLPRSGVPIARGWFRQDDFPENQLFYTSNLSSVSYKVWLCENQVAAVVLPPAPYDYSSVAEAALVAKGRLSVLSAPTRIGVFRIYQVVNCPALPYRVLKITHTKNEISFFRAGTYILPITYSPFATTTFGQIVGSTNSRVTIRVPGPGSAYVRD